MKYISKKVNDTKELGLQLGKSLKGGDIVLLSGFLGAGKTVFAKGIAEGLGIKTEILSPTFTILNDYQCRGDTLSPEITFCHIDAYRLKNENEAESIGLLDYIGASDCICVIEWGENIQNLFTDKKTIKVTINTIDENTREIVVGASVPDRPKGDAE